MVGRMERQTASSSASCSPSAAASSSACGGKKRPDILNMIRVRLNLLTLLLLRLSE
jgi:protein phosphatase 1L